jgi:5-methylthioribose kinase
MTADEVRPYLRDRLPDFASAGPPERLEGGNLNVVWRVPGAERSVIVKYAPPYIAANPDVPLDPSRIRVEARCLEALGPQGRLSDVSTPTVRAARLYDVNVERHVVVMEDVGRCPSLDAWLRSDEARMGTASRLGRRLGAFIGRLHATTEGRTDLVAPFDNRPMQETRRAVQYRGVADMLVRGNVDDAEALGARADALGEALLEPGRCLTMGDLWPPSVLVWDDTLRLIDWELAHYGRPLQDVAHWRAHLWMQRHRAPSVAVADAADAAWTAFREGYLEAVGDRYDALWPESERRDAAVHVGAEILVRAVGPFRDGYVYAECAPDHPAVREAVATAARHLRAPGAHALLSR